VTPASSNTKLARDAHPDNDRSCFFVPDAIVNEVARWYLSTGIIEKELALVDDWQKNNDL
jgi:hypothetical protein